MEGTRFQCEGKIYSRRPLSSRGTTVVPGRFFEMPQHFRIGIGGDTADLRAGLERLSAALDSFAKR